MRQALIPMMACLIFTLPASAQATRPAEELAKENAELKKRIEQLETYVASLEAKLRADKQPSSPRARTLPPSRPAPYGYQLPAPPFKVPSEPMIPAPLPRLPDLPQLKPVPPNTLRVIPPAKRYYVPENWQKREFNGTEYYLVPLE